MKPIYWADLRVLTRIVCPLAFWIDEHWHVNPWRVAIYILMATVVMSVVSMGLSSHLPMFLKFFLPAMLAAFRYADIRKLERISAAYERNPDNPPTLEWLGFFLPYNRLWHIIPGLFIFFPLDLSLLIALLYQHHSWFDITKDVMIFVSGLWFVFVGVGYYFAACPRPPGKRKEKKVRDWSFGLTPAGVRAK